MLPITEPRHGRALQQSLGIRGPDAPTHLESTLQGVVIVDDVSRRDEFADSPHVREVFGTTGLTSDATHNPQIWLPNLSTGTLFIVRSVRNIVYSGSGNTQLYAGLNSSAPVFSLTQPGGFKNLRVATPLGLTPAGILFGATASATFINIQPIYTIWPGPSLAATTGPNRFDCDIVLPPGFSLVVRGTDNAASLQATFEWDELLLAPA